MTLKSRSKQWSLLLICQLHLQWKSGDRRSVTCTNRSNTHKVISYDDLIPCKADQVDLFLVYYQDSLVRLRIQYYKSLCAAVTICATLVNIQTHKHTDRQTDRQTNRQRTFWPAYLISPASLAKMDVLSQKIACLRNEIGIRCHFFGGRFSPIQ